MARRTRISAFYALIHGLEQPMHPRQLAYFIVAARREHMGTAAAELGISEPALSRSIARLEREYGVRLFDRVGRGVRLNAYGKVALLHSERAFSELEAGEQKIRSLNSSAEEVTVGYIPSLGTSIVPKIVVGAKRIKATQLRFHEGRGPILRDMLLNGEVDLYIGTLIFPDPAIDWRPMWDEAVVAVVRRDDPLARRTAIEFRDLALGRWLLLRSTGTTRRGLVDAARSAGFVPDVAFESDDFGTILELVESGYGIALLPQHCKLPNETLVGLEIRSSPRRTIGVGQSRSRTITPAIAAVRDVIVKSALGK
ncbi:MAG TPA: LysR family transcriptional regulator [Candidatus Acidoferrales bacterium]|nr:LysR family transcriptional regulator [Candidatus Acidoferrales bacterium]